MQVATGATVEHPATDEQPPTLDLRGEVVALLEERARFVLGRAEADPDEIVWARSLDEKELLECRDVLAEEIAARAQQSTALQETGPLWHHSTPAGASEYQPAPVGAAPPPLTFLAEGPCSLGC